MLTSEEKRIRNAKRNAVSAAVLKVIQTLLPFAMRTLMLYTLGVEYLGLSSLFTSILQFLNLMELGIGSAMVYKMYQPIADEDTDSVNALLNLYRTCYRVIGTLITVVGVMLVPFLKYLIKDDVPDGIILAVLYLMNLATTAFSYVLFGYKKSLANALQRSDINSKVIIAVDLSKYALQALTLLVFKNYYLYYAFTMLGQIVSNTVISVTLDRLYPQYKPAGKVSAETLKDIKTRIGSLFIAKLGWVVLLYADTIVVSAFMGLVDLAHYSNYMSIMNAVTTLVGTVLISITAVLGNGYIEKTPDERAHDLRLFTFVFAALICIGACCFMALYQPFIEIWMKRKDAGAVLPNSVVVCLTLYFVVYEFHEWIIIIKDSVGAWNEDRFRPLISAICNLTMNILFVRKLGLYGIILSTVVALVVVEYPWLVHNLFTVVYEKKNRRAFLADCLGYAVVTALSCAVCSLTWLLTMNVWVRFMLCCVAAVVVPVIFMVLFYHRNKLFAEGLEFGKKMLKK